jgi:hypothetical protein
LEFDDVAFRFATGAGAAWPPALTPMQRRAVVLPSGDLDARSPLLQGRGTATSESGGVTFRFAKGTREDAALAPA